MPSLVFVAGPNGSGKSTLVSDDVLTSLLRTPEDTAPLVRINPDDILREMAAQGGVGLEVEAAQAADSLLREAIQAGANIVRETVLSTDRLLEDVRAAKALGYRFVLIFVLLRDPTLNTLRVAQRVALGGHDVPEERIRARWSRALVMLPTYAALADHLLVLDNSADASVEGGPVLLIEAGGAVQFAQRYVAPEADALAIDPDTPEALRRAMSALIELVGG